ncbi:MAG: energy-coupling factor transporter transmembrane component T family protein [Bacillales bacterium]
MNNIFGKYQNKNTLFNKLDSRIKLFFVIFTTIIIFLNYGNFLNNFVIYTFFYLLLIILLIIAKISFKSILKSILSLWVLFTLLFIINCFFPNKNYSHILYKFNNGFIIYIESLFHTLKVLLRIILILALTSILTESTPPLEITNCLEWYMKPLKLLKFPVEIISMTIALSLRFIPTLLEETQRILIAQKSRGVDYNKGSFFKKIKSYTSLIIPLLVNCFSRSRDLAYAMDARGYDPYEKRSHYRVLKVHYFDFIFLLFVLLVNGLFIYLSILLSNNKLDLFNIIFNMESF